MEENRESLTSAPAGPQMGVLGHQEAPHQAVRVESERQEAGSPESMPTPPRHDSRAAATEHQPAVSKSLVVATLPRRAWAAELATSLAEGGDVEPVVWWRRVLGLGASPQSVEVESRKATLQTVFADPLVIGVASPKGEAGNTITARCVGAALARERVGGVAVVDMDELRGTLALRSVVSHDGHIGHVLDSAEYLLSKKGRSAEVERCMNRQPHSYEWVLASDPSTTEPISFETATMLIAILKRFFSIIIIDMGHYEFMPSWQAAARAADIMVVPMKWRPDSLIPAAQMLDERENHGGVVEGRTIIVGTNGANDAEAEARAEAFERFGDAFPIFEVPVDEGLHKNIVRWDRLNPQTRAAFETIAAEVINLAQGAHHV